jgi:hypothetical protein
MTKRGRPPTHGLQKLEVLFRKMEVSYVYNKFRKAGEKHSGAVSETVKTLKNRYKISLPLLLNIGKITVGLRVSLVSGYFFGPILS